MDPAISGLVARKYQIQQQQADTAQRLAQSQAGLTDVQARLAPDEAAARNYATRGQGQAAYGQANLANTTASLAPRQLSSEDILRRGQAGLYGAEANRMNTEAGLLPQQFGVDYMRNQQQNDQANYAHRYDPLGGELNSFLQQGGSIFRSAPVTPPLMAPVAPAAPAATPGPQASAYPVGFGQGNLIGGNPLGQNAYHAAQGATKVPGKGDGKTDTQPAMLAPGEAVLNRGAAEHLGRDTISLLNAIGARRMGLTIGDDSDTSTPNKGENAGVENQTGAPPGYNYGTPYTGGSPGPGQTVTNGSWDPADAAAQARANSAPPPPMQPEPAPSFGKRLVPPKVPAMAKGSSNVSEEKGTKSMKAPAKGEAKSKGKSKPAMSEHARAHTPDGSTLPPGILQALLSMGQQGGGAPPMAGGMPPPNGPPAMPGSMMGPPSMTMRR